MRMATSIPSLISHSAITLDVRGYSSKLFAWRPRQDSNLRSRLRRPDDRLNWAHPQPI
jgi:hypothetical protein